VNKSSHNRIPEIWMSRYLWKSVCTKSAVN